MKRLLPFLLVALAAGPALAEDWTRLAGQFSRVDRARAVVVRNAADWRRLWAEHMGDDTRLAPPPVDFTKEAVVAVFAGEVRTAGCEVRVSVRPDGSGKGLMVLHWIQRSGHDGFAAEVLSQPFLFQKLARPAGPLVLEEAEGAPRQPDAARRESFKQAGERLGLLRKALGPGLTFGNAL